MHTGDDMVSKDCQNRGTIDKKNQKIVTIIAIFLVQSNTQAIVSESIMLVGAIRAVRPN